MLSAPIKRDGNHEIKWLLLLGRKAATNLDSVLKSRDITLTMKVSIAKSYGFSSSHVPMWDLDHKEGWALKNWCFQIVVLEKILESPLDCKDIKLVNPKENQPWTFTGRTDAEAETPVLWPRDVKGRLIRKDLDAEKDWKQEKEATKGEVVGWHHPLDGCEVEQIPRDSKGQGSLLCCSPWGLKEWNMTSDYNNNN